MVLPNGFVVGELVSLILLGLDVIFNDLYPFQALSIITNQDGVVECPFTNQKWSNPKIEKVYVM
jgi:hypothetical protein